MNLVQNQSCKTNLTKGERKMKQMNKNVVKAVVIAQLAVSSLFAMAKSRFRDDSFEPTVAQRSGLAFLRIIGSPLSFFTEGAQYFNENKEATGENSLIYFVAGMCVQGSFVSCFEATGGVLELISFQQFKSFAYPWEIDENDAGMVKRIREDRERERLQKEMESESDFVRDLLVEAAGVAAGAAVSGKHRSSSTCYVAGGGGSGYSSCSRTNVRPRVRHSSCGGSGRCNICKGAGYVGSIRTTQDKTRLRCRGCGGSGSCRACNGTGYAN